MKALSIRAVVLLSVVGVTGCSSESGILATQVGRLHDIDVDGEHVYVTDYDRGVVRVPIGGGDAVVVAESINVRALCVTSGQIYWSVFGDERPGAVEHAPKAGGPTASIPREGSWPWRIDADEGWIYWSERGAESFAAAGLLRVPQDGGAPEEIGWGFEGFALSGSDVYAAMNDSIVRLPKSGGEPTVIVSGLEGASEVAVDDTSVYWSHTVGHLDGSGTVMKAPKTGGEPTLLAGGLVDPTQVLVVGGNVYFVEQGPGGGDASAIKRVPITGGAPEVVASQQVRRMATDGTWLYWAGDGTIKRMEPPGP